MEERACRTVVDGYQKFVEREPIILEPEDWTPTEWSTLCKLCRLPADRTERIVIRASEIECFIEEKHEEHAPAEHTNVFQQKQTMNLDIERDAVVQALCQIEEYLETNIIPRLKFKRQVSVEFGELKQYGGIEHKVYEHSLTVFADGVICYRTGGLVLRFKPDPVDNNTVFNSWTHCRTLILCWHEVRNKLLEELKQQEQENSTITNFQV